MSTIPPAAAIRKKLSEWILGQQESANEPARLTQEQCGVATWIDKDELASLLRLLKARVEGRGAMPVPSNPHDAVVRLAADTECRHIMSELTYIATHKSLPPIQGIEEL